MTTENQTRPASLGVWPLAIGYILLRLLLTAVLAGLLLGIAALVGLDMPILVALILAIILQLPLAWLLLAPLREKVTAQAAASAGSRRVARDQLRAALAGDESDAVVDAAVGDPGDGAAADGDLIDGALIDGDPADPAAAHGELDRTDPA